MVVIVVVAVVVVVVVDEPKEKWVVGLEKCLFGCLFFWVFFVLSVEFVKVVQILSRLWFFFFFLPSWFVVLGFGLLVGFEGVWSTQEKSMVFLKVMDLWV